MDPVGWGILAPGKIARKFVEDLALVPEARVAAVGSRRLESAQAFAQQYGGTPYGSYAELVADPAVDVVYVASPHAFHPEHVRLAVDAGKPVLCEKPVALNAAQAEEMFAHARERGVFVMEAMWTACHPLVRAMLERLASGECGRPLQVVADLGFAVDALPTSRMLDPALGAGALLDMGIYPLTLAHLVMGQPVEERAVATVAGGIDMDVAIATRYAGGGTAALTASMAAWTSRAASVATDLGRFDLPAEFHHPTEILWRPLGGRDGEAERLVPGVPVIGRGYGNEVVEVHRCLAAGLTESPVVPAAQTLAVMRQMDRIREQIGVRYPGDRVRA
ncbi:Gfo/Idh/MocA family protein [Nocardioides terrisoli]|uniref:Gfo/Idh/MocA family protein n=1 Tax=Nocardioides terrisoli TaxID=3388267 RepID=UPI00287B797E|nr:Gfo/Idh/MocA family oxidoreductase [Nocardioides marmorisolisilvae]